MVYKNKMFCPQIRKMKVHLPVSGLAYNRSRLYRDILSIENKTTIHYPCFLKCEFATKSFSGSICFLKILVAERRCIRYFDHVKPMIGFMMATITGIGK
jgi:hypothetical protein